MRLLIFLNRQQRRSHNLLILPLINTYTYYIIEKRKADSKKVGELDFLRYNK